MQGIAVATGQHTNKHMLFAWCCASAPCVPAGDPLAGAAGTRFGRNVPLAATQPDIANLLHPNPLLVSSKLLQRQSRTDYPRVPFLNMWAGAWVQFMVHDW